MGLTVVFSITFAQPRIGATATIGILIAGQLVMGALIDRYGWFGVDQIAMSPATRDRNRPAGNRRGTLARSLARCRTQAKVWTALVTVYVIWGSTYLGIYYAGHTIPPLFAASTRFIAAGTIMALRRAACAAARCASRAARSLSCVADRHPAARRELGALLRRAQRADRARVADHRVGAALGRRAAPDARAAALAGARRRRRRLRRRRGARAALRRREAGGASRSASSPR